MSIRTAERLISAELRKRFGPRYRDSFEIRTCASNRAISVHWRGAPHETVIEAIGKPLVTRVGGDGLWFFQTHHNE
jgi:hypothetical protein